jgi:hypothetical protein
MWQLIDDRINEALRQALSGGGVPRPRPITISVPLMGATPTTIAAPIPDPVTGILSPNTFLTSIPVFSSVRIIGWQIHALVAGQIIIDLQLSQIEADPMTAQTLIPLNGPLIPIALNGYTTGSDDTSLWALNNFSSGGVINVFIVSTDGIIAQAVLGLELADLDSRVLQV